MSKSVYVVEEMYIRIVEYLGYRPTNLFVNNYVPEDSAIILDDNKQVGIIEDFNKEML